MRSAHAPSLQVTPEGVEVHPHRTGHARADQLIAAAAIFTSLLSLLIAYKHGSIMRDLVSANSWPLLQYESSNFDGDKNRLSVSLLISNAGVGPAIVKNFTVYYDGKPYRNPYRLVKDCCGYVVKDRDPATLAPGSGLSQPIEATVIKAGDAITYFKMELAAGNESVWRKLEKARYRLSFDVCYCSVLGECWRSNLVGVEPRRVRSCPAPAEGADSIRQPINAPANP